jgi:predicted transposase YbfD/YdcC
MPPVTAIQRFGYNEKTSLTVREEYKLEVFENWVLRKTFRSTRDEVMEERGYRKMRSCITVQLAKVFFR